MNKPNAGKPGAKPQSTKEAAPVIAVSRKAPPAVQPVVFEGVRYEQVMDATTIGRDDQPTGYLAAYDESNDRLDGTAGTSDPDRSGKGRTGSLFC